MFANRVTRLSEAPTLIISVLIVVMLLISGYYVYSQQPPNQAPVFSEGPVTEREIAENIRPQTNILLLPISIGGEVRSVEFFLYGVAPCVMFKRSSEFGHKTSLFFIYFLQRS